MYCEKKLTLLWHVRVDHFEAQAGRAVQAYLIKTDIANMWLPKLTTANRQIGAGASQKMAEGHLLASSQNSP